MTKPKAIMAVLLTSFEMSFESLRSFLTTIGLDVLKYAQAMYIGRAILRDGLFSRFSKNSRDGLWNEIRPIAIQIDLKTFSCSVSWAKAIKSDKIDSLLVPANAKPNEMAEAYPITEVLLFKMSLSLSPIASLPEANDVKPSPRQAPCITTSFWLWVGLVNTLVM